MPTIRLYRDEVGKGALPLVCLCCGAAATCSKRKTFSWHEQWIDRLLILGLFIYVLLPIGIVCALAMRLRMRVWVPLCDAHRNYWSWRFAYIAGGAAFFVLIGVGLLTFILTGPSGQEAFDLMGLLCVLPAGIALMWSISAAIIQSGTIRPTVITANSITLGKVSPEFIAAVEQTDERSGEHWNQSRRSTQGSQDFYDPESGRPGRLPPEGYRDRPSGD